VMSMCSSFCGTRISISSGIGLSRLLETAVSPR
jgi:hypothetical protein